MTTKTAKLTLNMLATLGLAALSVGFSPAASATVVVDALASVAGADAFVIGDATATADAIVNVNGGLPEANLQNPGDFFLTSLGVGDSFTLSSSISGTATDDGFGSSADSLMFSDATFDLQNTGIDTQRVTLGFDFTIAATAEVIGGDPLFDVSVADASIDVVDSTFSQIDILEFVTVDSGGLTSDSITNSGFWVIDLAGGTSGTFTISGLLDTLGGAFAGSGLGGTARYEALSQLSVSVENVVAVPEPGTLALIAIGLMGFAYGGRRRRSSSMAA